MSQAGAPPTVHAQLALAAPTVTVFVPPPAGKARLAGSTVNPHVLAAWVTETAPGRVLPGGAATAAVAVADNEEPSVRVGTTPTVLAGPHPLAAYAALLANALRPRVRFLSIIGSYGWGGKTAEQLVEAVASLKAELISPVACKGVPKEADYAALDALADAIAQKHRERNLV